MDDLLTAIEITVVGMSLVFGGILLLWGLIYLLVQYTAEPPESGDGAEDEGVTAEAVIASPLLHRKKQAAVAAVALALAQHQRMMVNRVHESPSSITSWQVLNRYRQLYDRSSKRRGKR